MNRKINLFGSVVFFILIYSCTTPKIYTDYSKVNPVINFNLCGIGPLIPKFSTEQDVIKFLGKPDVYRKKWVHRCAICLKERALTMYYTRFGLEIYLTRGVRRHDKRTIHYMKIDSTSQLKTESGFGIGSNLTELQSASSEFERLSFVRDQVGRLRMIEFNPVGKIKGFDSHIISEIWFY